MDYYGNNDPFGNNNPYGTITDQNALGFSNPMNSANMNPGFGINPALLTPSYQAPYRPPYAQTQGYSPYGNPGIARGLYNIFSPTKDPMYGNPTDSMRNSVYSVTSRPFDAAMWGVQNIGLAYAGYSGMSKILGPLNSSLWGMPKALWKGDGIAAGFGRGMGTGFMESSGIARGLGRAAGGINSFFGGAATQSASISAAVRAGSMGLVGGSLGLLTGMAIPFAAGELATKAFGTAVVDPYTYTRKSANDFRNNFSNMYFGGSMGNPITGKGIGGERSSLMGRSVTEYGLHDPMFSREDYSAISDYSARAGLLDNVNGKQITKQVKSIAEQIKLIISISKDPDIKNAIQDLSKLNLSGASVFGGQQSAAAGAYRSLGNYAAQAGTTVKRIMDTVGAQGQYMFQANGMTPYLGQLAAANTFAGFSAANRAGIISPAALARLGGVEGATQGSLTAQIAAVQIPLAMMGAHNRYIGGFSGSSTPGYGQSLFNTAASFSASMSANPLQAAGAMRLHGPAMAGKLLRDQGGSIPEMEAYSYLVNSGYRPKNGKFTAEEMMMGLVATGMSDSAAISYLHDRRLNSDPRTRDIKNAATRGYTYESLQQWVNQGNLGGGPVDSLVRGVKRSVIGGFSSASGLGYGMAVLAGQAEDLGTRVANYWSSGNSLEQTKKVADVEAMFNPEHKLGDKFRSYDIDRAERNFTTPSLHRARNTEFDPMVNSSDLAGDVRTNLSAKGSFEILKKIKELSESGNKDAIAFFNSKGDDEKRRTALQNLIEKNHKFLGREANKLKHTKSGIGGLDFKQVNKNTSTFLKTSDFAMNDKYGEDVSLKVDNDLGNLVSTSQSASGLGTKDELGVAGLFNIGAASELFLQLQTPEEPGGLKFNDLKAKVLSDRNKYGGILEMVGGEKNATNENLSEAIEKLSRSGMKTGLSGLSMNILRNNQGGVDFLGKGARTEVLRQSILQRGGDVYDPKASDGTNKAAGSDEVANYLSIVRNADKEYFDSFQASITGKTNFDDMNETLKKLDDSVTEFGGHVTKFGKYLENNSPRYGFLGNKLDPPTTEDNTNATGPKGRKVP